MTTTRSVALLVLVATVGLMIAPIASGAVAGVLTDETTTETETTDSATNTSVSMFMQSSAAETENAVDDGMFEAKYSAADNDSQTALVRDRTADLEDKLEALEAEREALREQQDDLHPGEYQARMTRLTVEIQSLDRSAGQIEHRADEAGVGDRVTHLQANASALTGPEVSEFARSLAGGGPSNGSGPPAETPGNESTATTGAEAGPPAETPGASSDSEQESDTSPPANSSDADSSPGSEAGAGPDSSPHTDS